jgi:hypothetical protein
LKFSENWEVDKVIFINLVVHIMTESKRIFLFLFVGMLALSTVQLFIFETEDLTNISEVEEQEEAFFSVVEIDALDYDGPAFLFFMDCAAELFKEQSLVVLVAKNYPQIHLAVPYSPPEFS